MTIRNLDALFRQNVVDYDDLLLYWAQMMAAPALAADVAARFDHVLVDRYQDTNRLQASRAVASVGLFKALARISGFQPQGWYVPIVGRLVR